MKRAWDTKREAYIHGGFAGMCIGVLLSQIFVFFTVFKNPAKKWKRDRYDCAIVCGCPAKADGRASEIMKARVRKAVQLWREGRVSVLIFSGGAVKNEYIEAQVMKEYAESLGVPEDAILTEETSVSTCHNMMHSRALMEKCGAKNCVVVTSRWHLRKADHYARKFDLDYVMCAADEPENDRIMDVICRYAGTVLVMYRNFYRGLY